MGYRVGMALPKSVPYELFQAQTEQLTQALQAIAALALTEEEVEACRHAHGFTEYQADGWAESMRKDMLADGKYGREALLDMLQRHEFLTNTHAGFIYGAFEGPQMTYGLARHAELLAELVVKYEAGEIGTGEEVGDSMMALMESQLRERGVPIDHIAYLVRLMGARISCAPLDRWRRGRKVAASQKEG
jgi:hypothetical protein